jgi:hypothetical protein
LPPRPDAEAVNAFLIDAYQRYWAAPHPAAGES